ncbi:MetQ/NlpA family ABC transporter substrate-binding protein [Megasphaera cerevisiae]|uniref:MetQ/NlpA family ABC transporter substrate-binding protein n=1 Tax=Megasphaera cerevisiae TaxID=39029 RepID=UPI000945B82C|nr:MetQ/NlpA family ABC transporter substrate-binding protein [Megasphaera cerevisiae]OKY53110.1 methionine ABC transporter substrate-binding protein [Megasphaera cerevisiae]
MKNIKKFTVLAASALISLSLLAAGCGSSTPPGGTEVSKNVTLTVGATPVPHGEILNEIKPLLAKEGVDLKIVEFTDYVKPNLALNDKELDANFFQHTPYLDKFNAERGTKLKAICKVHVEPMGVYSHKIKALNELSSNAKVAIPNDPTNGGRALLILQQAGLIELKDGGSISSTVQDITKNDKQLQFVELEAAQIPRSLDDVDIALINTNFAMEAGLNPLKDALFLEPKDSPYANVLVVRDGDENRPEIQKLVKALQSPEVKKFIEDKYQGAILPSF